MMPSRSCRGVKVAVRAGLNAVRAGFSKGDRAPISRPGGPWTLVVSGFWAADAGRAAPTTPARAGGECLPAGDARRLHDKPPRAVGTT